ncbi:MAG: hypothetical protein Greene071436_393 [Parcubacteria group bacterium Greene0714_36]|nr:MAG: hypothetical protein Greene071436_393 [Parcubacteria group bacterium Greene0714_36]
METILAKMKNLLPRRAFRFIQPPYHYILAYLAAARFWFPARRLVVIGVTGTKGKTTVVRLLHEVLASGGACVASVSSLEFRVDGNVTPNMLKMTMPGRFFLQKFLRRAVRERCRFSVVEVTSQGIAQFRHRGIRFRGAVMTNIAPEHIESHGGFEAYLRAKLDLFWRLPKEGAAVINGDDAEKPRFSAATPAHKIFYGKEAIMIGAKQWNISDAAITREGIAFSLAGQAVRSPLVGLFNFYNILAAIAVGLSHGIALERIAEAIGRVSGIAGRMEFVAHDPFSVVVDYAHTPDSLRKVYETLRRESSNLICVLGAAGGGRDRWKRPEFGRIAAEYCAQILLTDEDPYDEDPAAILEEIVAGIPRGARAQITIDRRQAIGAALALRAAGPGDTVVITGKGSEPWMMVRDGAKVPWDDRAIVREILHDMK